MESQDLYKIYRSLKEMLASSVESRITELFLVYHDALDDRVMNLLRRLCTYQLTATKERLTIAKELERAKEELTLLF